MATDSHMPPLAAELLARATRLETPCGAGRLVWHRWGEAHDGLAPVVLFHGGSGSWTHWLRNIDPLLAAGRQVLVPDLPGFGDSELPPGNHDADGIPEPIEQGLAEIVGSTRCALVGFSFGSMVAGLLAADMPWRATQLVVVGAPALGVVPRSMVNLRGWRHLSDEAQRDAVHRHNLGVIMFHDHSLIDDEALALHKVNVVRDRIPGRRLAYTELLARALSRVQCPVDAIYGDDDAIYRGYNDALAAKLPTTTPHFRSLQMLPATGHWAQYESADAFDEALARVLLPA